MKITFWILTYEQPETLECLLRPPRPVYSDPMTGEVIHADEDGIIVETPTGATWNVHQRAEDGRFVAEYRMFQRDVTERRQKNQPPPVAKTVRQQGLFD